MAATPATENYLKQYITERLPALVPGYIEGVPDLPDFAIDQRHIPFSAPM
jgi:hypothetical protein